MPRERPSISKSQDERGGKAGKIAVAIVVILIGIFLYFMLFTGQPVPSKATGLLEQAEIAIKAAGKESFTFEGAMELTSQGGYIGIPVSGEGRIDSVGKRMYMKMNFESPVTEIGGVSNDSITIESYVIDDVAYIHSMDNWLKYSSPGRLWGQAQFSQKIIELVKGFDAAIAEKGSVNGREAYKVSISPSLSDLANMVAGIDPQMFSGLDQSQLAGLDKDVKSVRLDIWIGTSDYLPIKIEGVIEAQRNTVAPEVVGAVKQDVALTLTVNFDYKTPFNIVLPSAAQNAQDISAS